MRAQNRPTTEKQGGHAERQGGNEQKTDGLECIGEKRIAHRLRQGEYGKE